MIRRLNDRALAWNGPLATALGGIIALGAGLTIVRLVPLSASLVVVLGVVGVSAMVEPLVAVGALLFWGPMWAWLRAELPQVPAQIAQLFFVLAVGAWLGRKLARREIRLPNPLSPDERHPILLALSIFLAWALLSLWDAVELPVYGVPELIKWVQILLLLLLIQDHLTDRRLPWLLGAILVTGLFQAGVGIWQFALRGEGPEHFAILGDAFYRAYGTFEQPNPYAGYLGMTLSLAVGIVAVMVQEWLWSHRESTTPRQLPRYVPAVAAIGLAMLGALGMSWSRGGWLGFAAAAGAMALALPRKARRGAILVALLAGLGLLLYATGLMPGSVRARLTSFVADVRFEDMRGVGINDANYAVIERLAHWQSALEMMRHNLWTGVGFGCYEPAYDAFALINWPFALGHAHNYYLTIAAETGLPGLLAYLALWATVIWQTWRVTRRAQGLARGIAVGLVGTWTHLSVHHLLDNLYVNNVHLHIGVLLGLLVFLIAQSSSQPKNSL